MVKIYFNLKSNKAVNPRSVCPNTCYLLLCNRSRADRPAYISKLFWQHRLRTNRKTLR